MTKLKFVLGIAILLTIVRAGLVFFEQISPQEAYYAACAAQPAAAYFDGPAGTAITMGQLERWDGLAGRLSMPIWALAATLACFYMVRRLTGEVAASGAALVLNALPVFNAWSLRIGPELPALTFGLLALYAGWRGFESERSALFWWLLCGLLIGAASNFIYATVAIAPVLAVFLWYSRKHRNPVGIVCGITVLVVPALLLFPALRWNAQQDWIPIAGGTLQTAWQFNAARAGSALLDAIYLLSPIVAIGLVLIWWISARGTRTHLRTRFVFICALPGMLLGFYAIYRGDNPAFFFLLATPLLLARAGELLTLLPLGRLWATIAVVLAVILSLPVVHHVFGEGRLWSAASTQVRQTFVQGLESGQDNLFLIAEDAPMASILGYYLKDDLIPPPGHPTVYVQASQDISSQFSLWPSYDDFIESDHHTDEFFTEQKGENPFVGRDALYVTREPLTDLPQAIRGAFESVTLAGEMPDAGEERLYIYRCLNYQTLPL